MHEYLRNLHDSINSCKLILHLQRRVTDTVASTPYTYTVSPKTGTWCEICRFKQQNTTKWEPCAQFLLHTVLYVKYFKSHGDGQLHSSVVQYFIPWHHSCMGKLVFIGPVVFSLRHRWDQDRHSLSGKTPNRTISWILEVAKFGVKLVVSLWWSTGGPAALLSSHL